MIREFGGTMKTAKLLLIASGLCFLLVMMCTHPTYDNPLDLNGDNPSSNVPCLGDSDGDGIADIFDPDAPAECHRQSTPTLTLIGDSIAVIAFNDPHDTVPKLQAMVQVFDSVYKDLSIADVHTTSNVFTSQCGGHFTITYTVKNMANGIATLQRTVIVDCKGPEIYMKGTSPVDVDSGKPYVDSGATAYDSVDKEVKQVVTTGLPLNTATVHEDSVIYTATDKVGNPTRAKRIVRIKPVIIIDNDVPVITLIGSADTSIQIGVGSYSDPGATAWDTTEHDITAKIVKTGSVNAAVVANYTLTYNVSDNAGHAAATKTRLVHITQIDTGPDVTKPEVVFNPPNPDSIEVGHKWVEPGYHVWDNRDTLGLGATVVITGGPIDTTKEGNYTLIYTVKDKAGNPSIPKGRTVVIYKKVTDDKIPPIIKLDGACGAKCTTDIGTKYTGSATATDSAPGKPPVILTQNIKTVVYDSANAVVDFNTFYTKLGLYKITYDVSDVSGNKATQVSRTVFVRDTTPLAPDIMFAKYGVPLTDSLPTITKTYSSSPFEVDGPTTGIPTLNQVKAFRISWDLYNKQVYGFEFQLTNGNTLDFRGGAGTISQTFGSKTPKFTLTGVTAIKNLNGTYYIVATASKCVWVRTDGRFAIIFK
jgi:hypothetical protein